MSPVILLRPRLLRTFMAGSVALALPALAAGQEAVSTALGTLLFSPTERTAIEQARRSPRAEAAAASHLTIDGVVHRPRQRSTVWLNGRAQHEGATNTTQPFPRIDRSLAVTIDGQHARVGEVIERSNGARTDLIPPGAITSGRQR